jgi:hypothetical protein
MALLQHSRTQRMVLVEPELLIGRSPAAGLCITEPYVSAQHAVLRWAGAHWVLKDLGSRNGTFLNGVRIEGGRNYDVGKGAELAFGRSSELWTLTDDAAPPVMAIPLNGGDPIAVQDDVIGIPSSQEPLASIFRDVDGQWKLEAADGDVLVLEHHKLFEVGGRPFRFACPDVLDLTANADSRIPPKAVTLSFRVSRDEEHVELTGYQGERVVDLGSRTHNYLLLTLARARLEDAKSGLPDAACGWVYLEDLLKALRTVATQLNIDVFRIRQQFAKAGLGDAINIIERRPRSKQLRIGTGRLEIELQ